MKRYFHGEVIPPTACAHPRASSLLRELSGELSSTVRYAIPMA